MITYVNKKIDYLYVLVEQGEERAGLVKIGHSINPLERPAGYQAGNPRKLTPVLIIVGGLPLETEISRRFASDKIGTGGDEWYRVTPELVNFLQEKTATVLSAPLVSSPKEFGDGPIRINGIELGEPEPRPVSPVQRVRSIQPYTLPEASAPKSRYARLERNK